jgi:hypothetical protein
VHDGLLSSALLPVLLTRLTTLPTQTDPNFYSLGEENISLDVLRIRGIQCYFGWVFSLGEGETAGVRCRQLPWILFLFI